MPLVIFLDSHSSFLMRTKWQLDLFLNTKKPRAKLRKALISLAERVGFEPTRRFTAYSISSRAPSTSSATSPGIPYGVSETSCVCFFLRRCRKKSRIICAHSSALTPAVTAIRWFKASFCAILKRDSTAPAFTSALP